MNYLTILKNLIYIPILWVGLPLDAYGILFILMIIDIVSGVAASYVIRGKHSIKSHLFSTGIVSKVILLTMPLVLALVAKGVGIDIVGFASNVLSLFILSEGYSIVGNYISIRRKEYIEEFDAIGFILSGIQKTLLKIIGVDKRK